MKTKSKKESDAYMAGWQQRHLGIRLLAPTWWSQPEFKPWFERGWHDYDRGAIDAESALGPELLVEGGRRYGST